MTRDINDLFALIKVGTGAPTTAGSHSGGDTAKLIEDLENELAKKQNAFDHKNDIKVLMDKLTNMQDRLDQMGQPVQAEDILRWNENVYKTRDNTEEVDKIKKWMQVANFDMLKQEINSLNVFVLTLTPKLDFEKTQGEVRKVNAQITDIEYNLEGLTAKINDVD